MPPTARRPAAGPCTGAIAVLLVLAACAAPGEVADDGGSPLDDDLVVDLDRGDGTPVQRYTLTCDAVGGDLPDPPAACAHLRGLTEPFAPLAPDVACTEQYGGPQTAHVTGRWRGRPVDLALSRVDGCRIAQWDSLGPLLPGPVGVLPE